MTIQILPPSFRGYPLTARGLNTIGDNGVLLADSFASQHLDDGNHNAMEIPLLLGRFAYPTVELHDTSFFTSFTNPSTGRYDVTFPTASIIPPITPSQLNVRSDNIANKPHIASVEFISASVVAIRISWLTSALGSGNSWASVNADFDLAIHSLQRQGGNGITNKTRKWKRGDRLLNAVDGVSALAKNQGALRQAIGAEHTYEGEHSTNRVARSQANVSFVAGSYDLSSFGKSTNIISVTTIGTGICDVELKVTLPKMALFVQALHNDNELVVSHAKQSSSTVVRVYSYKFNFGSTSWSRFDPPFFLQVHGGG